MFCHKSVLYKFSINSCLDVVEIKVPEWGSPNHSHKFYPFLFPLSGPSGISVGTAISVGEGSDADAL